MIIMTMMMMIVNMIMMMSMMVMMMILDAEVKPLPQVSYPASGSTYFKRPFNDDGVTDDDDTDDDDNDDDDDDDDEDQRQSQTVEHEENPAKETVRANVRST